MCVCDLKKAVAFCGRYVNLREKYLGDTAGYEGEADLKGSDKETAKVQKILKRASKKRNREDFFKGFKQIDRIYRFPDTTGSE